MGCGVLAVLCWLGWLAGLGWAGDAGKDELGRLGWPGQAGRACLDTFSCFFVAVALVVFFEHLCVVFDAIFELWFTLGLHFRILLAPLGGHLDYQGLPWAALCTPFGLL